MSIAAAIILAWLFGTVPAAILFKFFSKQLEFRAYMLWRVWFWPLYVPYYLAALSLKIHEWVYYTTPSLDEVKEQIQYRAQEAKKRKESLASPPHDSLEKQFEAMK